MAYVGERYYFSSCLKAFWYGVDSDMKLAQNFSFIFLAFR